jgi:hypothetical protein
MARAYSADFNEKGQFYVFWASRHYTILEPSHTGTASLDQIQHAKANHLNAPAGTLLIDQEF